MTPEAFFENFAYLADAPNGVQKLRELILQLAVRGKLVPQDPTDEPAAKLLERIRAEKARLVKEKKIRKADPLPPVTATDAPYTLPQGWVWVRLADCLEYDAAAKVEPNEIPLNAWLLDLEDIEKGSSRVLSRKTFQERQAQSNKGRFLVGDVLYGKLRPYLNKVVVADDDGYCTTEIISLRAFRGVSPEYVKYFLRSRDFLDYVNSKTYGVKMPRLGTEDGKKALFPVPPSKEQLRIVAKVDQLMAFCDKLEARQQMSLRKLLRLNNAALDRLTSATGADAFTAAWQLVRDGFDLLYTTQETIGKLRQGILLLAVQGRLVPQQSSDEPAGKLLERIREEKVRLVKERKIRSADTLPPANAEDAPYELPQGWELVRFGHILADLRYGTSKCCDYSKGGTPVLRIPNLAKGSVSTEDMKFTDLTANEIRDLALHPDDLLLIRSNGSERLVGRSAIVHKGLEGYAYAGYLVRARSYPSFICAKYIYYSLESSFVRSQIEGPIRTTSGVKNINSSEITNLTFSLPPLAEQYRIVAKIDQLMALCDKLESKLTNAQTKAEKLTTVAVQGVLAA